MIMENFGPYKDTEVIDFTGGDGVTIIWGDNGRGKTSIMNAFTFLFFGEIHDRHNKGSLHNYFSYINTEGMAEGNYTYKITLDVTDDDHKYSIIREIKLMPDVTVPKTNEDLAPYLSINRDGIIVSSDEADHIIKRLMPDEVSRFFLFNGELLQQYEELLDEGSEEGYVIKNSIEQILGLPIISNGSADIEKAESEYQHEALRRARNDESTKQMVEQVSRMTANVEEMKKNIDNLKRKFGDKKSECEDIRKKMQETEKLRLYLEKRKTLENAIANLEKQRDQHQERLKVLLADSWHWMVSPTVVTEVNRLTEESKELNAKKQANSDMHSVLKYLEKAVADDKCPVCDHQISNDEQTYLREKIRNIKTGTVSLTEEEEIKLHNDNSRAAALRSFIRYNTDENEINQRCMEIDDCKVQISNKKNVELKELNESIRSLEDGREDESEVVELADRLIKAEQEVNALREGIKIDQESMEKDQKRIIKLNKKIADISTNVDVKMANERLEFVKKVQAIFDEAVGKYRDKLKDNVEVDASRLFLKMSDEEDYKGLSINDRYGLNIVDENGNPVPNRSAGWEQIVAFSLIGALHKNAPFNGPIIMDFPFSRMSDKKKRNMMKVVPDLAPQVVLLVMPGEIDANATRSDIGAQIVQELTLKRISSRHTHIERSGNNG